MSRCRIVAEKRSHRGAPPAAPFWVRVNSRAAILLPASRRRSTTLKVWDLGAILYKIKDFKYGLGLAHIPTGSLAANQAYFMIAALAWNLKTWMLNLLHLGDGAVMRFQRFRYQWIWQAGVVAMSGRNTVVLKLPAGEYFQRFGVAMARLATL